MRMNIPVGDTDPPVTCKDGTVCDPGFDCVKDEKKKEKDKSGETYSCQCKQGYVSYLDKATNTKMCVRKY